MKLFDAKPSAIRTFGLRIKQFLTASNIELSDILETPSYFIIPPWCIKPPKIVLDLVHLKKDRTDASIYKQLFMEIRDRYRDYIPVYTDDSRDGNAVACATVFSSNTVISMTLPDSASVFTAEVWAIIKALEQIKDSTTSKYIVFTDSLSCLQALHHMKLEHPLIGMVIRKCVFFNIAKKDIVFVGYPAILALRATKRRIQLPSLPWSCLVPKLVYPIMILNIVSTNISFPLGKMIGTVRSWTSFILSSQSWEIGSPPTSGAGRMKLACVVPASVIRIWPIHISWRKILHLCVSTVNVIWQFATFWWSAIILLKKGNIYLVEEMWWNRLDSTLH